MGSNKDWFAPFAGVAFLIVLIASFFVVGEPPSADEGAAEVVEWYVDNKDAAMVGAIMGTLAGFLLIVFGTHLRKVLQEAAGGRDRLALLAFIGFVIVAVGAAIDGTLIVAAAEAADDEVDPTSILALQALWDNDWLPFLLGATCFLWGTGLSILRTGVLPKWLGWIMVLLGVLAFTPIGFVSFLGSGLLVVILSIILGLRARKGSEAPPPPPAPAAAA